MAEAPAEAEAQQAKAKKKRCRSRVAEKLIRLIQQGTCLPLAAKEAGLTEVAARNILSRAGISLRAVRAQLAARRQVQPHSPAARLIAQANDTAAVQELRAATEEMRPVKLEWQPALRALGFPVPRRQSRRAAAAALRQLHAQQYHDLLRLRSDGAAAIMADVIEREFHHVDSMTFRPRRRTSWEVFRSTLKDRFQAIADGRVVLEPVGTEEGLPLYRMNILDLVAAAVRRTSDNGYRVAPAKPVGPPGRAVVRGTLLRVQGALATILSSHEKIVPCAGLVVRCNDGWYETDDLGLLQPDDRVAVLTDGRLRLDAAKGMEVVRLMVSDLAHLAAWCIVGEPCWIKLNGTDQRWRCDLPATQAVALVDVASLDWSEAADDSVDVVKVRPHHEGSQLKYKVVTGAWKVADAVVKGYGEIPVVVEIS